LGIGDRRYINISYRYSTYSTFFILGVLFAALIGFLYANGLAQDAAKSYSKHNDGIESNPLLTSEDKALNEQSNNSFSSAATRVTNWKGASDSSV
jgi:hypothetical protein